MKGFTLIELLITSTIIIVLSGASVATFLNFRDRRAVNDDASAVADRLRTIQTKATAVEIPSGCTTVTNYKASWLLSGANLTVVANCPGVGLVPVSELNLELTNSVFQSAGDVTFDSRTISATATIINICGNNHLFTVETNRAAVVYKPVYVPGGC